MRAGITHVYLGLEDLPDSVYPQNLIEELRDRIENNPIDLVISFLPAASRFLLSYDQELFPSVPKVFSIPGTRDVQKITKLKNAVIIPSVAEPALQSTMERIFSVLPTTQHLVVVCGNAPFDHNYLEMAKKAITSSKRGTKVSYLVGLEEGLRQSKDFNQSTLMSLPDHIAVLDREGKILTVNITRAIWLGVDWVV